ncbi:MAG: winged helix-turn-helix transcriptional regulator [Lachnospiraceae bacterium]|nr:winged helix-turn-helix transcriptional regulator [Lachnospiraceae bacterium]
MEVFDIRKFDEYREDNRREVKKAQGGLPNSLWETYSSMANCYGGVIILGVVENPDGSFYTTGLKNAAKMKKNFWDTINNQTKVSVNLLTDDNVVTYDMNGDVIMVIYVPRARREQRPVYINNNLWNGTYRRNWEGDYHCTQAEIKAMLRDQPEETMDMMVLEDFSLADLSDEAVQGYRNYHAAVRPGHVWEKLPKEEYLEKIGAVGRLKGDNELKPTAAGLLMFGEEYRIVRYFPDYFLDYREVLDASIRWTDRIQSSSGDWSGNLFDFFFRVYNKLTRDFEKPFALDGAARVDDTPVHKAVREALANCIVNSDFYLPRGIVILKEQDKVVLQNPGSIRTGKKQMLRGGISDPRNKAIMKMLNLIAIGERAGSGVPDIYSVWADKGWTDPEVEEQFGPDRTILTLAFTKKTNGEEPSQSVNPKHQNEALNKALEKLLDELKDNPQITQTELSNKLLLSRATIQRMIKALTAQGILERKGGKRFGYWEVKTRHDV